ncbi:MAG: biopolymer transporter ExbD [Verrucomicrobiales bacterium]|nr:biopolymer transporter ExbD [Verrucomicrobiales bacterium]
MSRIRRENKNEDVGFQIAPMIDVVFVIMLFFMVKVGARQVEMEIKSKLPGSAETSTSISGMEALEENIAIDQDGIISHNEEMLDGMGQVDSKGEGADEKQLKERMKRLAEQGKADKTEVIVTVSTQPDTKYSRIIKVMNALQYAGIRNVTFTVAEEL